MTFDLLQTWFNNNQKIQVFWGQSKEHLRLCRWKLFFTVGINLPEISVTNYNTEFFFYKLWSLISFKPTAAKMKNLSVLGSKERKASLIQLKTSFTYGRYIFNTFNVNNMIEKVSFSNCDPWSPSYLHTSKN